MRIFAKCLETVGVFMPIEKIKKFDFTAKNLVASGIRTCTFIVKNREHYHSTMVTTFLHYILSILNNNYYLSINKTQK